MPAARPDMPAPMMIVSYTSLLLDNVFQLRLQVGDRAGEAGELLVILFGDLDAVPLAELHHDVEEVHAVQLKLLAKGPFIDEAGEVFIGGNVRQNIEDFLADFRTSHQARFSRRNATAGFPYSRLIMTAELI